MPRPKTTKEQKWEQTKRRWAEALRGEDGLKRVNWSDCRHYVYRFPEVLDEPVVMTADSVDKCVLMSLEGFYALAKADTKQPKMMRIEGVLHREKPGGGWEAI